MKPTLYLLILLLLTILSCSKQDNLEYSGLIGNWELREVFDGYANGGNFNWNNVPDEYTHTLTFSTDGKYLKKENLSINFMECVGTFKIQSNNIVEINSNCNTVTERLKISELTSTSLILDRQVIEEKIRYKYSAKR